MFLDFCAPLHVSDIIIAAVSFSNLEMEIDSGDGILELLSGYSLLCTSVHHVNFFFNELNWKSNKTSV
jgi:hypothetical protein